MEEIFKAKMQTLTTEEIIDAIRKTWNDKAGEIFREIGFMIIEEREGEEESDRAYSMIWKECNA